MIAQGAYVLRVLSNKQPSFTLGLFLNFNFIHVDIASLFRLIFIPFSSHRCLHKYIVPFPLDLSFIISILNPILFSYSNVVLFSHAKRVAIYNIFATCCDCTLTSVNDFSEVYSQILLHQIFFILNNL